jgi:hypothetical protein
MLGADTFVQSVGGMFRALRFRALRFRAASSNATEGGFAADLQPTYLLWTCGVLCVFILSHANESGKPQGDATLVDLQHSKPSMLTSEFAIGGVPLTNP